MNNVYEYLDTRMDRPRKTVIYEMKFDQDMNPYVSVSYKGKGGRIVDMESSTEDLDEVAYYAGYFTRKNCEGYRNDGCLPIYYDPDTKKFSHFFLGHRGDTNKHHDDFLVGYVIDPSKDLTLEEKIDVLGSKYAISTSEDYDLQDTDFHFILGSTEIDLKGEKDPIDQLVDAEYKLIEEIKAYSSVNEGGRPR